MAESYEVWKDKNGFTSVEEGGFWTKQELRDMWSAGAFGEGERYVDVEVRRPDITTQGVNKNLPRSSVIKGGDTPPPRQEPISGDSPTRPPVRDIGAGRPAPGPNGKPDLVSGSRPGVIDKVKETLQGLNVDIGVDVLGSIGDLIFGKDKNGDGGGLTTETVDGKPIDDMVIAEVSDTVFNEDGESGGGGGDSTAAEQAAADAQAAADDAANNVIAGASEDGSGGTLSGDEASAADQIEIDKIQSDLDIDPNAEVEVSVTLEDVLTKAIENESDEKTKADLENLLDDVKNKAEEVDTTTVTSQGSDAGGNEGESGVDDDITIDFGIDLSSDDDSVVPRSTEITGATTTDVTTTPDTPVVTGEELDGDDVEVDGATTEIATEATGVDVVDGDGEVTTTTTDTSTVGGDDPVSVDGVDPGPDGDGGGDVEGAGEGDGDGEGAEDAGEGDAEGEGPGGGGEGSGTKETFAVEPNPLVQPPQDDVKAPPTPFNIRGYFGFAKGAVEDQHRRNPWTYRRGK